MNKLNNENYLEHKKQIVGLHKEGKLKDLRFDENYFDVMKHSWLIDDYIARFGWNDEEVYENTLPAYEKAIKEGYPILLPVQMLDEGELICFADSTLARVANVSGYVTKMNLADIKEHKIKDTDCTIPTLTEALDTIKGRVPVILDIYNECNVGKMEEKIRDEIEKYIEKYNLLDSVAVMSLNPYSLQWFCINTPWIPRILRSGVFKVKRYANLNAKKLTKLKYNKLANADYIAYNAKDLPCKYIKKHRPVGVIAYNVKSQEEYLSVAMHCDNIIFDSFRPEI